MARRTRTRRRIDIERLERRDCPAAVSISAGRDVSEAGEPVRLIVSLAAADSRPVAVSYMLSGDAAFGRDYRLSIGSQILGGPQGTLSFRPGETSKTITVSPIDDTLRETSERLTVTLVPVQNATISGGPTTVTFLDDDNYLASIVGPTRVAAGSVAEYTLQLSSRPSQTETFYVSTVSDSAETPDDYRPLVNMPVVFRPGELTKTFRVQVLANQPSETDEVFVVRAAAPAGFPAVSPFSTTIIGNGQAPPPWVSVAAGSVLEGNAGTSSMWFTVSLSAPAAVPVTVSYSTADGTATLANQDYVAASGVVTFAPGETSKTVAVTVTGDTATEADETMSLVLSNPTNARIRVATATGMIRNDDNGPPPPQPGAWTILVYMTGENLNTYARDDINEMETALAAMPAGVRIVVAWDQPRVGAGQAYATGGGSQAAWRTYGRSVLTADSSATIASTFDLTLGERNTGDPVTLIDFVRWGVQQAPASRYALQLWGHGGGLDGSQFDSESGGDALTINELAGALGATGMPAFDVVSYDNCLMAMAEVGYALAPRMTGQFVASEELVPGTGQDYRSAYAALNTNPAGVTAAGLAAGMVSSYQGQYQSSSSGWNTFSAVASGGYTQLISALSQFVVASDALSTADRTTMLGLVNASPSLSFDVASFRDLGRFMTRVAAATALPPPLRTAATAVGTALLTMVSAKTADPRASSGVSIYLPTTNDSYLNSYAATATAFCQATGWDRFARWLGTGNRSAVAVSATPPQARGSRQLGSRGDVDPGEFAALQWVAYGRAVETAGGAEQSRGRPFRPASR